MVESKNPNYWDFSAQKLKPSWVAYKNWKQKGSDKLEEIALTIDLKIKTKMQASVIGGVLEILYSLTCIKESDYATMYAIVTDCPFLL